MFQSPIVLNPGLFSPVAHSRNLWNSPKVSTNPAPGNSVSAKPVPAAQPDLLEGLFDEPLGFNAIPPVFSRFPPMEIKPNPLFAQIDQFQAKEVPKNPVNPDFNMLLGKAALEERRVSVEEIPLPGIFPEVSVGVLPQVPQKELIEKPLVVQPEISRFEQMFLEALKFEKYPDYPESSFDAVSYDSDCESFDSLDAVIQRPVSQTKEKPTEPETIQSEYEQCRRKGFDISRSSFIVSPDVSRRRDKFKHVLVRARNFLLGRQKSPTTTFNLNKDGKPLDDIIPPTVSHVPLLPAHSVQNESSFQYSQYNSDDEYEEKEEEMKQTEIHLSKASRDKTGTPEKSSKTQLKAKFDEVVEIIEYDEDTPANCATILKLTITSKFKPRQLFRWFKGKLRKNQPDADSAALSTPVLSSILKSPININRDIELPVVEEEANIAFDVFWEWVVGRIYESETNGAIIHYKRQRQISSCLKHGLS